MVKHLRDGQDFGPEHFPTAFGFTRSAEPARRAFAKGGKVGYADGGDVEGGEGEADGGAPATMAKGGHIHPHGHDIATIEQHEDGTVAHHHTHGGFTLHHPDGQITHHGMDGAPLEAMAHGGIEHMHDSSEYAHRGPPMGGDGGEQGLVREAQHLASRAKQHEKAEAREEKGEGERDHKAFGGPPRRHPGVPHPGPGKPMGNMMPAPGRSAPPSSPPGAPAGGAMPYGTQPSSEPGSAGITQLKGGGRMRRARGGAA